MRSMTDEGLTLTASASPDPLRGPPFAIKNAFRIFALWAIAQPARGEGNNNKYSAKLNFAPAQAEFHWH